jgi:hypothetical protein
MAPRSYLSRIAQPLIAGDPVVWSVPRAAAEESRPAATPSLGGQAHRVPTPDPATGPKPRPERSLTDAPRTQSKQNASADPTPSFAEPAQRLEDSSKSIKTRPSVVDETPSLAPTGRERPSTSVPARRPTVTKPLASRQVGSTETATIDGVLAAPVLVSETDTPTMPPKPKPRPDATPEPQWPSREETALAPRTERAAPAQPVSAAAPRLHIGAIEIRASAPPPVAAPAPAPIMAAAPSPAAGRIGRAYAWRFGLVQG